MMNLKSHFYLVCCSIVIVSSSLQAADSLSTNAARLRDAVKYLASDELRGRAPGTEGNQKALQFVADAFKRNGVQPLDTSYFQPFSVLISVALGTSNSASVRIASIVTNKPATKADVAKISSKADSTKRNDKLQHARKLTWKLSEDYTPLAFTEDSATSGSLLFAGYGISAKELKYDDYTGIDAKGKIVIVLRGTPEVSAQNSPHSTFQPFASLRAKALNAREHGAAAVIFVNSASESVSGDSTDVLPALKLDRTGNSGIVVVQAKIAVVNNLLPPTSTLQALEQTIVKSKLPASFALNGVTMTLATDLELTQRQTANVIGVVRGTDTTLRNQYIIVGAHCDHLGMGEENSLYVDKTGGKEPKIHFGADDNASGTAGVIALVETLARKPLKRSVVVMAFNGEESGLLGSQWYCKYPKLPLEQCAFMLNMDMIGRMKNNALSVHGTGTSSRWDALVDSLGKRHQLTISKSADGFGPSDHSSFYGKNIPVLFLFTGLHDDYHRPSDTWDKINYAGQETVVGFAEDILRTADANPQKPDFVKVQANQVQRATGFRVYVGTIPDYNDHPKGMRISGVREGSPAQKAGLQEGDVITKLGTNVIKNVYDYTYSLANFKAGDKTTIVVLREGSVAAGTREVALELTFEARK